MSNRQKYPVFVEETTVRLIWIEGDNAEDAAKQFSEYPGDYNYGQGGGDPVDGWITGIAPSEETGRYDWYSVYGWSGAADEQDMHVTWHRIELDRRKRAAHAELGHPGVTDRELDGKRWCPDCTHWVDLAEVTR
jgi:hypothetical protein